MCHKFRQESLANAKVSARQQCMNEGPLRRNLRQINARNIILKSTEAYNVSLIIRVYLHSFCSCCRSNLRNPAKFPRKFELIAVQGHPTSLTLVPIESTHATSY